MAALQGLAVFNILILVFLCCTHLLRGLDGWSDFNSLFRKQPRFPSTPRSGASIVDADATGGRVEPSTKFEDSWPQIKEELCPNMKPNVDLGQRLFQLAREELKMKPIEDGSKRSKIPAHEDPYGFAPGGWVFAPREVGSTGKSIVYLRIFKAANNQIRFWSQQAFGGAKGSFTSHNNIAGITKELQEHGALDDACIVTAVRDPVGRFMSGYNEIELRAEQYPERLQNSHPLLFARYENGSKARFEQFVADYVGGPDREGWEWYPLEFGHIWSMSGVLSQLALQGAKLTAYLPSIANITYTWPAFLASTCPDLPGSAREPMNLLGQHESSSDPYGHYAAAKAVWAEQGATARALCALNAMDYACWDKLPVPPICQDVFSSDPFLATTQGRPIPTQVMEDPGASRSILG